VPYYPENFSDRRAYLHYSTSTLLYHLVDYWCLTSAYYNTITGCSNGLGFFHTKSYNEDVTKTVWTTEVLSRSYCPFGTFRGILVDFVPKNIKPLKFNFHTLEK